MPFPSPFDPTKQLTTNTPKDDGGDYGPPVLPPSDPPPTTTTTPPPDSGTGKPFDYAGLFNTIFGNQGNNQFSPAMIATYLASAYNHYRDAGRYQTDAERYAGQLDPFRDQRSGYQDMLHRLMTDPQGYLQNDPFYQGQMRLTLGPAASMLRAKGYGNSGNIMSELTKLSGDVTSKYINDLRDDLGQYAGANFSPASAASILGMGMQGSIDSRNQALGDIGNLFAAYWRNQGNNGKNPTGNPTGDNPFKTVDDLINAFKNNGGKWTNDLINAARQLFGNSNGGFDIQRMFNAGLSANDIMSVITNGNDMGTPYPTNAPYVPPPDNNDGSGINFGPPPPGYDNWSDFWNGFYTD